MNRIEQLQAFLAQTPDDCFLNHALALEYCKRDRDAEAEACFRKNLAHDPGYVATYYHLGRLLERTGRAQEAIATYELGMAAAKKAGDGHTYNELQAAYEDLAY